MPPGSRARRWLKILAAAAVVAAIAGWWIDRQLEPQRLVALVLGQAGKSLQLDLRFTGTPAYALRPEPRLLIPALEVRSRADGGLILSARRAELSLPWATITGGAPVITRIELDSPVLDVAALQRWIAARPPTPFKLPTFTRGLHITDGRVLGDGFELAGLALSLSQLQTGVRTEAHVAAVFRRGDLAVPFDAVLDARTPGLASDFTLSAHGTWPHAPKPLPFGLDLGGRYSVGDAVTSLTLHTLSLQGDSPLPRFVGSGELASAATLALHVDGTLADWPADWPALPAPLSAQTHDLPLRLAYRGRSDFSDPLTLHVVRNGTEVDASVRVAQLQAWLDAPPGNPLPPLAARVRTPRLVVGGATLEGVEVEMQDEAPAAATP